MNFDIDFAVPFRHRVRFTSDLSGNEFDVLTDLLIADAPITPKVLLVVDDSLSESSQVSDCLIQRLQSVDSIELIKPSDSSSVVRVAGGERCKNSRHEVDRLLSVINQSGLDRRSYIIVVGGGAVLDAVGYAAALAHRGIRLIRIPTTTLAQADSGVGVKNAINQFGKKNWLGTFAVPWAVINDSSLLKSLSDRDFNCGFSEAVKVSLLKSESDFDFLCDRASDIFDRDMDAAFAVIQKSCRHHLQHITTGGDPFEMQVARPLDFGHWSAHRLEDLSGYQIRHGEAVAIGVALDGIYSSKVHGLSPVVADRVCRCLTDLGLPIWNELLNDTASILSGLEEFRQHLGGRLTLTMLDSIAKPIDVHQIDLGAMKESIKELVSLAR